MCEFWSYVAFYKATNGQTDIQYEKERMLMASHMEDETNKELQSEGYKKSKTAFKKTNQNTQEVNNERFKKKYRLDKTMC